MSIARLDPGETRVLEILPLVDWNVARPGLRGEAGVSYLVRTDRSTMPLPWTLNASACSATGPMNSAPVIGPIDATPGAMTVGACTTVGTMPGYCIGRGTKARLPARSTCAFPSENVSERTKPIPPTWSRCM